jgi:hypothetical protein
MIPEPGWTGKKPQSVSAGAVIWMILVSNPKLLQKRSAPSFWANVFSVTRSTPRSLAKIPMARVNARPIPRRW